MNTITGKGYLFQETTSVVKKEIIAQIESVETIEIEIDDSKSPKTANLFLEKLPFTVGVNLWGDEIYTDASPVNISTENAKELVELNDVAYWPNGKAICLFFGPTPIGKKGEIKPYSPVNIIGKIVNADKKILSQIGDGMKVTFKMK